MRDVHGQISTTAEGMEPPECEYRAVPGDPTGFALIYDSPRKLCSLLLGAIEGTAMRYGERAQVHEQTCMRRGDPACQIVVHFSRASAVAPAAADSLEQQQVEAQRHSSDLVYAMLPDRDGITLTKSQERMHARYTQPDQTRPSLLLEALNHLHHAG